MPTLMYVKHGDGSAERCDAKCYNAQQGTECKCCCGGMNHAAGFEQAMENTKEMFGDVAEVLYEFGGVEMPTNGETK